MINLLSIVNIIMACFDRLEGKHVDHPTTLPCDASTSGLALVAS
jgi:hypothetical protein